MQMDPYQSEFMTELAKLSAAMIRDLYADPTDPQSGFKRRPTDAEWYLRDTLVSAGELITLLSQLRYSLAYLSGYRARRTDTGELVVRSDYIAFMMENFLIRVGMVEDRALKLANVVFRLGLPRRECRFRSVAKNDHIVQTDSHASLQRLRNLVDPYREKRNSIVHHERYSDEDLTDFEGFFILTKDRGKDDLLINRACQLYKEKADDYVKAKRNELAPFVDELSVRVTEYLDTLLSAFWKRREEFLRSD